MLFRSGVDAGLHLQGIHHPRVFRCEPLPLTPGGDGTLVWPLRLGEENRLAFRSWRWSPLGLGALVIALLLPLVIGLQRLRRQLGFGLPELPA